MFGISSMKEVVGPLAFLGSQMIGCEFTNVLIELI